MKRHKLRKFVREDKRRVMGPQYESDTCENTKTSGCTFNVASSSECQIFFLGGVQKIKGPQNCF